VPVRVRPRVPKRSTTFQTSQKPRKFGAFLFDTELESASSKKQLATRMNSLKQQLMAVLRFFEISEALILRARFQGRTITALLYSDGCVTIAEESFDDLEQAMLSLDLQKTSSSAWQFWLVYSHARGTWVPLEHWRAEWHNSKAGNEIKTSLSHPLRIDSVSAPDGGLIGMTFCPGKQTEGLYTGLWQRDLVTDCLHSTFMGQSQRPVFGLK
jgi:hypothetical protein